MRFPDIMRVYYLLIKPQRLKWFECSIPHYLVRLLILLHINEIHSLVLSAYCLHLLGSIWLDCSVTLMGVELLLP